MQKAETEWKRLNHSPGKSPISGQKRNARKRVPAASIRKVAFRIKPAIRMIPPTWGAAMASCMRQRCRRPMRLPVNSETATAVVTTPIPPVWMSRRITACPNSDQ